MSFQACNFVFPYINKEINGETRPRPNVYRKSLQNIEDDLNKLGHNQLQIKDKKVNTVLKLYTAACKKYIKAVTDLWDKLQQQDNIWEKICRDLQWQYIPST